MGGKEMGDGGLKAWVSAALGPGPLCKPSSEQLQSVCINGPTINTSFRWVPQGFPADGRSGFVGTKTNTGLIATHFKRSIMARFSDGNDSKCTFKTKIVKLK